MPVTGQTVRDAGAGLFATATAADAAVVADSLTRVSVHYEQTDGGTAGTAAGEKVVWKNNSGSTYRVVQFWVGAPVAVTANDTNFKNFNLFSRTSAGASQVAIAVGATTTTGTGSLTAFAPVSVTPTAANVLVVAGSVLTASMTVGGTGVAIGSATAGADLEVLLEKV